MNDRRNEIEDLAELSQLPPGDPRRQAFESRPGARARLKAYEAFMAAGGEATPAERAEAEAKLGALIERETGVPLPAARREAAPPGAARESWLAWLWSPRLRPAVATVAVLAVVTLAAGLERRYRAAKAPVYRSEEPAPAAGAWDARPATTPVAGGAVRLSWAAAPGADRYRVEFLAGDLAELARVEDLAAAELVLDPRALPAGLASGAEVLWRVVATRGADEIARSPGMPLLVP